MISRRWTVPLLLSCGLAGACTPYQNLTGDFYIGPVDPAKFPKAYQGAGYDSGGAFGMILPVPASVAGGTPIAYYSFPATAGVDPTVLRSDDGTTVSDRAPFYLFDGDDAHDTKSCTPPSPNYEFDVRHDFVRFDRQGNVFQEQQISSDPPALPSDDGYVPVYAEVPVTSGGEGCQTIHSSEGLVANSQAHVQTTPPPPDTQEHAVGVTDGKYLAVALIDPTAQVYNPDGSLDPVTALGPQRFGWFNHFLVAYIEGGYIPTAMATVPGMNGAPDTHVIAAQTATLYAPNTFIGPDGNPAQCDPNDPAGAMAPCVGNGFDVIDGVNSMNGARGQAGYSPICHVLTYTPADPTAPAVDPADIDPSTLDPDTGTFIYCFQVAQ